MNLKSTIRKLILGLDIPNEYVCLGNNVLTSPLQIIAESDGDSRDVTDSHILLGYKPLLLGIFINRSTSSDWRPKKSLKLEFRSSTPLKTQNSVAELDLQKIHERALGQLDFFIFEGVSGRHRLLSPFHQWMNRISESFRRRKTGNVGLPGNLYDQVRIAYAVPRTISVYTVSDGRAFNMFPTDLHGVIDDSFYVGSLRRDGFASKQVETCQKIALSNVRPEVFREVYAMGKNHMKELSTLSSFPLSKGTVLSEIGGLPLPDASVATRELERIDSFDAGIHRIHFYRIVSTKTLGATSHLAHIHSFYAQWRIDNGLPVDGLIR